MRVKPAPKHQTAVEALAVAGQARHIERVLAAVVEAGSVSRAAWGLRMETSDIQKIVDDNK